MQMVIPFLPTPDAREVFLDTLRGLLDNTPKALGDLYAAEENVRQVYSDRFVSELLQNARDAAARRGRGRPRAMLALEGNVLLVANDGEPFTRGGYEAITGIGRSPKTTPGGPKLIGKKGIGFKSVLRVSSAPQVFSRDADGRMLALSFGDAKVRRLAMRALAREEAGFRDLLTPDEVAWFDEWLQERGVDFARLSFPHAGGHDPSLCDAILDRLPVMMFPCWCAHPPDDVAGFLDGGGYDTVVRLPLRPDHVEEVARRLADDVAPTKVLFLGTLAEVQARVSGRDAWARTITADWSVPGEVTLTDSKDGRDRTFRVFSREISIDLPGQPTEARAVQVALEFAT